MGFRQGMNEKIHRLKMRIGLMKRRRSLRRDGMQMIGRISAELDRQGADFFADYGTLLGIMRGNGLIAWDDDIDFGIHITEEFGWEKLEQAMNEIGFRKNHQFRLDGRIMEQNYSSDTFFVDFFRHEETEEYSLCHVFDRNGKEHPAENAWDVMAFRTPPVRGRKAVGAGQGKVFVPEKAEEYLAAVYGPNWRVPDPGWKTGSGPATTRLEGKFAYMEK